MPKIDLKADNLGEHGDAVYEMLMMAHEGRSEEESHALNIRLVLIMANHIGDARVIEEIIDLAQA